MLPSLFDSGKRKGRNFKSGKRKHGEKDAASGKLSYRTGAKVYPKHCRIWDAGDEEKQPAPGKGGFFAALWMQAGGGTGKRQKMENIGNRRTP